MSRGATDFAIVLSIGLCVGWNIWCFLEWKRNAELSSKVEKQLGVFVVRRSRVFVGARQVMQRLRRLSRQNLVQRDLPDFFELLALAHSAGATLPRAWLFASRMIGEGPLAPTLSLMSNRLLAGQLWDVALDSFAREIDDKRCSWVVGLMRQNLQRGSSLSGSLIEQVGQWRHAEAMRAEHRAQTLSLKLLFPIFVFLLPAVFLILFGPLLARISKGNVIF